LALEAWWVVIVSLAFALLIPEIGRRGFRTFERAFAGFAERRTTAIIAVFLGTIFIRVVMLIRWPIPVPFVHDEFCFLVQADMFAHGRLAFPAHPMARYFETFYMNFSPTYSSIFPPGQPAVLAFGQLLGHPWIGVLLSCAAMSAAVLWMLQGWLPARWALLGTILFTLRIGILSYWMNSYWGGAVAATGAALVIGTLPRIQKHKRFRDALWMGIGAAVLANSRPLEGFIFCIPVAVGMGIWLWKLRRRGESLPIRNVILPLSTALVLLACFTLYYNWRVTGDPFEIPNALFINKYLSVRLFLWQKILPVKNYANPQFQQLFNVWSFQEYDGTWAAVKRVTLLKFVFFGRFFLGVFLSLALITFPWVVKDRRLRLLVIQFTLCLLGLLAVTGFRPHYAAPIIVTFLALLMQCLRHLRQWEFRGRPVGIGLSRVIVLMSLATTGICFAGVMINANVAPYFDRWQPHNWGRVQVKRALEQIPGDHLVIVRYGAEHDAHQEWVYNAADIDHARIVWAREIPGLDLAPLLDYYPNRKVWVVEPDIGYMSPYTPAPANAISP
jgi:hypothetical protein